MKKLVSIFLITLLCMLSLTPVATPVLAAAEDSNRQMVEYLTGGMSFSAEGVTRAEMAAGFIRLVYEDVPLAGTGSFSDVALGDAYANEIYTALSMNIISQAEKFNPDDAVTYAQAIRMAVSLLGYGEQAEAKGGYPAGYLSYAGRLSLTMQKGSNDTLLPEEAIRLLAKTAEADLLALSGFTAFETVRNASILHTVREIEEARGIVTANEHSSLYNADGAVHNGFALDGKKFRGSIDSGLLGYAVKVYYKEVDSENEACFVVPVDTDVVTLTVKESGPIVNNRLQDEEGEEYKIEPAYNFIYNGKAYSGGDAAKFFQKDTVTLTLIDAGEDGVYETIHAKDPAYLRVSRVEDGIGGTAIYDNEQANASIQLHNDSASYEVFVLDAAGLHEGSFESIEHGSLLSYCASEDKKLYTIIVCEQTLQGVVTSTSKSGGTVTMGETEYIVNDAFGTLWGEIMPGIEQNFMLDEEGRLVALAYESSDYMYGWIVAAKTGKGLDKAITLKIFNEKGEMDVAALSERVAVDGVRVDSSTLTIDSFNSLTDDMRLVRYRKSWDEEPKIVAIDYAEAETPGDYIYMKQSTDINNSLVRNQAFSTMKYEGNVVGPYDGTLKYTRARFSVDGDCKFFAIPKLASARENDIEYSIDRGVIAGGYEYTFSSFDTDIYGQAGAVVALVDDVNAAGSVTTGASVGLVDSVYQTIDEEGDQVYGVTLAVNGKLTSYLLIDALQSEAANLHPGDIIRFHSRKTGYITAMYKDFDFATRTLNQTNTSIAGQSYGYYDIGLVYSANSSRINIIQEGKTENLTSDDFRLLHYGGKVTYIYVRGDKTTVNPKIQIRFEPLQEVKDYVSCGADADYAVVFGAYNNSSNVFIYRYN